MSLLRIRRDTIRASLNNFHSKDGAIVLTMLTVLHYQLEILTKQTNRTNNIEAQTLNSEDSSENIKQLNLQQETFACDF